MKLLFIGLNFLIPSQTQEAVLGVVARCGRWRGSSEQCGAEAFTDKA